MSNNLYQAPALESLTAYDVNRAGQYEAVQFAYYDFQTYAAAGQTRMTFFQVPLGQGGKTLEDTNMETAGMLPTPKHFLVQSIELFVLPNINPAALGAAAIMEQFNDVYDFGRRGWLDFYIGSKSYLQDGPLFKFPPKNGMIGFAATSDATTAAAALNNRVGYANMGGAVYRLKPEILLKPNQNFNVSLNWSTVQPLSADTRVGVSMSGILYRQSQ